ncbi:MAG: hypothetical protein JWO31_513 [Phycisphaerales bacterium]|nr:hypothetical protein [Phycisphaerales bacterium]
MARILVVDDTDSIRLGLSLLLRRAGHEPLLAAGGADALDLLAGTRPDLILLDLSMPEVDGLAVLEELQDWPAMAGVPIIVYSAVTDETTRRQVTKLGAAEFISKGAMTWPELARRLEAHLNPPAGGMVGELSPDGGPARQLVP